MYYIEQYYEEIQTGKCLVSERMQIIVKGLVEDLDNTDYIYTPNEAHRRIRFQEKLVKQSKGKYTGKPIKLCLWQKAFWEVVYSFRVAKTGRRRFTEALLLVARKNGKSSMMAADALYDLLLGKGISIACLSNTDTQAKLIWEEIDHMRQQIDPRDKLTGKNQTKLYSKKGFNSIFRLTSKMNALDGQNISKCYFDEAHECIDDQVYQSGKRSMSAQDDPLIIICTTNGFCRDHFLDEKIKKAHQIADGEIEDTHFLAWLYEQDSEQEVWQNQNSWQKSNPSLPAGIKKQSFLEAEVDNARNSATDRVHLLVKDFNLSQIGSRVWLKHDDIYYKHDPINLIELADSTSDDWVWCVGSVDLAKTTDLASAMLMFEKDNRLYVIPHYWIPKGKLIKEDDANAGAKYKEWSDTPYLTITDETEVSQKQIAEWFYTMAKEYKLRALYIGYDQWNSKEFAEYISDYGFDIEPIKQGYYLSNSMYVLKDYLENHNINFQNEQCTAWCLSNVEVKTNELGQIKAVKGKSHNSKIDGAVALVMAIETYRNHRKELKDM